MTEVALNVLAAIAIGGVFLSFLIIVKPFFDVDVGEHDGECIVFLLMFAMAACLTILMFGKLYELPAVFMWL